MKKGWRPRVGEAASFSFYLRERQSFGWRAFGSGLMGFCQRAIALTAGHTLVESKGRAFIMRERKLICQPLYGVTNANFAVRCTLKHRTHQRLIIRNHWEFGRPCWT